MWPWTFRRHCSSKSNKYHLFKTTIYLNQKRYYFLYLDRFFSPPPPPSPLLFSFLILPIRTPSFRFFRLFLYFSLCTYDDNVAFFTCVDLLCEINLIKKIHFSGDYVLNVIIIFWTTCVHSFGKKIKERLREWKCLFFCRRKYRHIKWNYFKPFDNINVREKGKKK